MRDRPIEDLVGSVRHVHDAQGMPGLGETDLVVEKAR